MVATLLALLAATPTFAEPATQDAHLSVTATVIRPVEISAVGTAGDAVLVIRNSPAVEVHALGGTITEKDGDGVAIKSDNGRSLTLTLVY